MPRSRRARRGRVVELPAVAFRYLADLLQPGDEARNELIGFKYFADPVGVEEAWAMFGEEATAAYARVHPGRRPRLWWQSSAPERERRKVGGTGRSSGSVMGYGFTIYLDVDPADPAMVESQAAFLARHDLLLPDERPPAEAFEPEPSPALAKRRAA